MANPTPSWPIECEIVLDDMWDKALARLRKVARDQCQSPNCFEMHVTFRLKGSELQGWTKPSVTIWEPVSRAEELVGNDT